MTETQELQEIAEVIRLLKRAGAGLPLDEPQTITDFADARERTRLTEKNVYRHSAMKAISEVYPFLNTFDVIAEEEKHHFVSEDGEQRKEEILIRRPTSESNVSLTMPQIATAPVQVPQQTAPVEQKKKHFWSRGK